MTQKQESHTASGEYILPARPTRFVLLHYHIFKNAGTTIEFALRRTFGEKFVTLHGPDANAVLSGSDVAAFLLDTPGIAALSSHHLKYPKPVIPGFVVFDLCLLRDPLERLWSLYKHFRRADAADEFSAHAKEMDLGSFFDFLVQKHPHLVNDVQVTRLANEAAYTRPPDSTDLAAALNTLREMSVIGVVDLFDKSLVAAEYFLRPAFPQLQLAYIKQNVSPDGAASGAGETQFREEVGATVYRQLQKMNRLDYELVSRASDEVRRRFALVPSALERLAGFRARCAALARHAADARQGI